MFNKYQTSCFFLGSAAFSGAAITDLSVGRKGVSFGLGGMALVTILTGGASTNMLGRIGLVYRIGVVMILLRVHLIFIGGFSLASRIDEGLAAHRASPGILGPGLGTSSRRTFGLTRGVSNRRDHQLDRKSVV